MLPHEHSVVEPRRKRLRSGPGEAERRGVGAEGVVGDDRPVDQLRVLRLNSIIDVLAVVAEWPAVKSAVAHRRDVVGDEIAAELVALIYRNPEGVALWLPREAHRVPKPRCEDAMVAGGSIDLPDRRARLLVEVSVFHRVAVGAHRGVELRPVRTSDDILRPVMIDAARG